MTPGVRRWLGTAAVLLAGLTVGGIIMLSEVRAEEATAEARAVEVSRVLADSIRTELEAITAPADALHAQIVAKDGKPVPAELGVFARQLLDLTIQRGHPLKNLALAPGNVVEAVWPLEGNEAAVGLDLAATPTQWDPIKDRIAAGEPVLTGPVDLVEGGRAFIYRTPVFLADGTYWGLCNALLDYSDVADLARAAAPTGGVYVSAGSASGDVVEVFGSPGAVSGRDVAVEEFAVPGATWRVAVAPRYGSARIPGMIGAISVVVSCLTAALTYWAIGLRQGRNSSRERLEVLAREAPGMLFQYRAARDGATSLDYLSPRLARVMGWDASRLATDASSAWNSVHEQDLAKTQGAFAQCLQELTPLATRMRMRVRDGQVRWFQVGATPEAQPGGDALLNGYIADITEEMDLEERLAVHASVFQVAPSGGLILSAEGIIGDVNPAFTALTGFQPGDVVGRPLRVLPSDGVEEDTFAAMWRDVEDPDEGMWRGSFTMRVQDGRVVEFAATARGVRGEDGGLSHVVFLFAPLSDLRDDIVTGLPGRAFFVAQGDVEIGRATDSRSGLVLALVGLDRFADLNDSVGHLGGDAVLGTLAARLEAGLPGRLALARVGGDEFAVLLPAATDPEDVVGRLNGIVAQPFTADGTTVQVAASIGVSTWPQDAPDAAALLEAARMALRSAKMAGRGQCRYFTQQMRDATTMRVRVLDVLDRIHRSDDFSVAFQPIVELRTGRVVKAEALARLNHPSLGPISPEVFIPIAEENGRIEAIGDVVFAHAARLACRARTHYPAFSVAVNISPVELRLPARVHRQRLALLQTLDLPGSVLTLEITEQAALQNDEVTRAALKIYRDQGAQIAIDDFGTGYSSLSYLSGLSADYLKIDRSFVQQLAPGTEIFTLVSVITEMARSLHLQTVAEGIETTDQLQLVQEAHCEFGQGYLFGAPQSGEELLALLREQPSA